ncbi:hypothetical protein RJ639_022247 [Escallonia herrerae]|uniref:BRCT domain-containing protein n=1 Tax=Escallonia herrerae TaxID=1293975 RepID=A0AA88V3N7_9ASTE|nr:hypothetical protein RJ639_022247 [Escallonia herrerae]
MGSLGDGDDIIKETKQDSDVEDIDSETETFDGQLSPRISPVFDESLGDGLNGEDADDLQFLRRTMLFDGTVPRENAFGNEAVNFDGETQMVDLGSETQALECLNCADDMDTQLVDNYDTEIVDSEDEGTDRTEVLSDNELSDGDSVKRAGIRLVDQENLLYSTVSKQGEGGCEAALDPLADEELSSGSTHKEFTSVRAASIRASGLAAHNSAFEGSVSGGFTQSLKDHKVEQNGIPVIRDTFKVAGDVDQEVTLGKYTEQMKGSRYQKNSMVGKSTARKLFTDEILPDIKGLDDHINNGGGADLSEYELAGLSYADSQEPGESSQAIALDVVDRFLKINVEEIDEELNVRRSTLGNHKPTLVAKGTQRLAKSSNFINTVGERGIFDWDDTREDEGGGEFFTKKKAAFFDNRRQRRRAFTQPREPRRRVSKTGGAVKESADEEERLNVNDKIKELVHTNLRPVSHEPKSNNEATKVKGAKFRKDLIKEMDEQLNSKDAVETAIIEDVPELLNVGIDTQMAAEAMETLCFGFGGRYRDSSDAHQGGKDMKNGSPKAEVKKRAKTRQTKSEIIQKQACSSTYGVTTRQSKKTKRTTTKESSMTHSRKVRKQCDGEVVKPGLKKVRLDTKELTATNGGENLIVPPKSVEQTQEEQALEQSDNSDIVGSDKKLRMQEKSGTFTPIACRTRQQCLEIGRSASSDMGKSVNIACLNGLKDKRCGCRFTKVGSNQSGIEDSSINQFEQSDPKLSDVSGTVMIPKLEYPKRRRSRQNSSSIAQGDIGQSIAWLNKPQVDFICTAVDLGIKRKTRSSVRAGPVLSSLDGQPGKKLKGPEENVTSSTEGLRENARLEASPSKSCKLSASACTPPVNRMTPVKEASPICVGEEYIRQSCRKNLSSSLLMKELGSLTATALEPASTTKNLRRRSGKVKVLLSHHLDEDTIKQQKKILEQFEASVATSMSDATHFMADEFVRTRNMLEAIALGKPVVTPSWLESCRQAKFFIDEKNHLLRDARKEKEFGFSMPVSLAHACKHPILQATERIGRSALKDDKVPDDLLVLSCEEDYELCLPFLRKGAAIYSSELLLHGIVIQKLEYERLAIAAINPMGLRLKVDFYLLLSYKWWVFDGRHRLFVDHVKRTRSTIWLKQATDQYHRVTKCK